MAVTERAIDSRLDALLSTAGSGSVQDEYARLASERMLAEIDIRESTRQVLIREAIAGEEGLDDPTRMRR